MQCPQCQAVVTSSMERCFQCGHVLRVPTTLVRGSVVAGRYEILASLGKGGMGMVYKARDHQLEETVAIKVLRPEVASDPEMERRFRTEIRLARKVRHRNVCGIYEFGDDAGLRYIAMEYVEGVDLRQILSRQGGLPPAQAFDTCIRVAEGLQAIHEAGIVHRDLKPANLMQDARGETRLMDFGIAKQVGVDAAHGATATGLVVGTPEYMSPEQARGIKIDQRSDVYALGIVTFEIFSGHVPFRGETPIATIFKHLQEAPPLEGQDAPPLPASLVPVLKRALAKSPDERFASAAEFAQALAEARDAEGLAPLTAHTPPTLRASALPGHDALTPRPARTVVSNSEAPARTVVSASEAPAPSPTLVERAKVSPASGTSRRTTALVFAGLMLAVVIALVIGLMLRGRAPARDTSSVNTNTLPARGTLVIDALPWGEIVRVTDARGSEWPLPAARFTPLVLDLPAGDYTLEVRHPDFPRPLTERVVVSAEKAQTRVEFRRIDAADYFKRTGL